VTVGRGYVPAEMLKERETPIGTIFIDSFYSPVLRVNYKIETTRIEKRTDYEKLILEIWTNGGIFPEDALALASVVLKNYFKPFYSLRKEREFKMLAEMGERERELRKILKIKVEELELSVRCANCLRKAKIKTIKDLIKKTETEMLEYPNFGRKSLQELIDLLKKYGLSFGTDVSKLLENEAQEKSKKT
jgi:DNA-directed RNA polymerase subunit alpha